MQTNKNKFYRYKLRIHMKNHVNTFSALNQSILINNGELSEVNKKIMDKEDILRAVQKLSKEKRDDKENNIQTELDQKFIKDSQSLQERNSSQLFGKDESQPTQIQLNFYNQYCLVSPIFEPKIFKCQNRYTGLIVAAKFFHCNQIEKEKQQKQIQKLNQVLGSQPHKHILWFNQFFHHNQRLIGITELMEGGNLWQIFQSSKFQFSLQTIKTIMKALLKALNHLHSIGIIHRDIKLTNIIFRNKFDFKTLKVIDFEFATFLNDFEYSDCGTEGYMAPEVLQKQNYNEKCDIFSAGVIFYILLFQKRPQLDQLKIDISCIQFFTDDTKQYEVALNLIKKMLEKNYHLRSNSEQCLNHEFFHLKDSKIKQKISKLSQINFQNPFKKLMKL